MTMIPPSIHRRLAGAIALSCLCASAQAQAFVDPLPKSGVDDDTIDLTELSLEELMNLEVTVASGSKQKLSDIPAAVYVLTGDEIRRAGHSSIQEALRMVPGFQVARWTGDMWDVTARGYGNNLSLTNEAFLNQLLVMVDGVPLYSPLFAGVWYGLFDIPMEDIDRVEIIRGPGGIVWGSNTVHGVVNVITKNSADTTGGLVSTWYGSEDQHYTARGGVKLGDTGFLRVWAKRSDYDSLRKPFDGFRNDWDVDSAGFRADWGDPEDWHFHASGRAYDGRYRNIAYDLTTFEPFSSNNKKQGGYVAVSAKNEKTGDTFAAWYQKDRQNIKTLVDIDITQFDLEYKREFEISETNRLNAGIGYRQIDSDLHGDDPLYEGFAPEHFTQHNPRAFAVNTIDFPSANAQVVLGLQVERNEFTEFEFMPSIRGSWRPSEEILTWASVSRAVRTPSLEEATLSDTSVIVGNDDLDAEELIAFELGGRWQPDERVFFDLATFWNIYDDIQNTTTDDNTGQLFLDNDADGDGYGFELAVDAKPIDRWSLRGAFSYLKEDFDNQNGSDKVISDRYSPKRLFNVRSYFDVTETIELDLALYMVDGLHDPFDGGEYVRADVRLGWNPTETLEMAIGVQNFGDKVNDEYTDFAPDNNQSRRQAYFTLAWMPGRRTVD